MKEAERELRRRGAAYGQIRHSQAQLAFLPQQLYTWLTEDRLYRGAETWDSCSPLLPLAAAAPMSYSVVLGGVSRVRRGENYWREKKNGDSVVLACLEVEQIDSREERIIGEMREKGYYWRERKELLDLSVTL